MTDPQAQHTQGADAMKDEYRHRNTARPASRPSGRMHPARRRFGLMPLAAGLAALLLPLAAGVSAQTPLRWDSSLADGAVLGNSSVYSPRATMARVFPGNGLQVMPLALSLIHI